MFIKVDGKKIKVKSKKCKNYTCLSALYTCPRSVKKNNKIKAIYWFFPRWLNDYYYCFYRDYYGCPDNPKLKEKEL